MNILEEVKGAGTIGISGHVRPDGDCVGSCMGLYLYLRKTCPEARIQVMLEKPADVFSCIAAIEDIDSDFKPITETFDVFIALDSVKSRIGKAETSFDRARKKINIDHHISNISGSGDVNFIVPEAGATSELIYEVIPDKKDMDAEIAKALYIGIVHDTGVFQYSNTSPRTLRIVADLISYGFDFSDIIEKTFYEKTYVQNQILGRVLLGSTLFLDGRCILGSVDRDTMDFYHADFYDLEGIATHLRNTRGVDCSVFIYSLKEDEYKVSMRSNGVVDVAKVAASLGGGGHVRAAGATLQGSYDEVVGKLLDRIGEQLAERENKTECTME